MKIDEQYLTNEIENFRSQFCTYGYLDIKRAVSEAIEAGFDGDWAFQQLEWEAEELSMKVTDLDPCYTVMNAILQLARNEIIDVSRFDVQNDASFETMGNFCATTYDWRTDDVDNLTQALREHPDALDSLSDATKYWLSQVEIDFDSLTGGK